MNTGQTLLTLGAMVLLSLLILRARNSFLSTNVVMMNSKFSVLATSLAQSQIEEIKKKAFDQNTVAGPVNNTSQLTNQNKLGPESGESYPDFNDVDDFNGYLAVDSTLPSAVFDISCEVHYVNPNNLDAVSHSRTWSKDITVYVSSPSMEDTIKVSSVFSYWVFR
jgi:hypothetical protein